MLLDTDHIRGIGGDRDFVWESFVLGYNSIYMDPFGTLHELTIGEPVLNEPYYAERRTGASSFIQTARSWSTVIMVIERRYFSRSTPSSAGQTDRSSDQDPFRIGP